MKIKPDPLDPGAFPNIRGVYYVRDTRWGPRAQAWPRNRSEKFKNYERYKREEFKNAARLASSPEPLAYETAVNHVKGTQMVPRDVLIAAMYANAYDFILQDGTKLLRVRDLAPNPQYVLDLITQVNGVLIYRRPEGWVALLPGNEGDILTMKDGYPTWHGEPIPPPPEWEDAWITTLGNDSFNGSDQTIWTVIEPTAWVRGGAKTRITLRAASTQALHIGPVYWGEAAAASPHIGFANPPTQVLFAGEAVASIPAGTELASDEIDLPLDTAKRYIYAGYRTGTLGGIAWGSGFSNVNAAFKDGNSADQQSPTGYSTSSAQAYALTRVEVHD